MKSLGRVTTQDTKNRPELPYQREPGNSHGAALGKPRPPGNCPRACFLIYPICFRRENRSTAAAVTENEWRLPRGATSGRRFFSFEQRHDENFKRAPACRRMPSHICSDIIRGISLRDVPDQTDQRPAGKTPAERSSPFLTNIFTVRIFHTAGQREVPTSTFISRAAFAAGFSDGLADKKRRRRSR